MSAAHCANSAKRLGPPSAVATVRLVLELLEATPTASGTKARAPPADPELALGVPTREGRAVEEALDAVEDWIPTTFLF